MKTLVTTGLAVGLTALAAAGAANAQIMLYENENFSGRNYWIFCSDANFQGNCHTYGPGDYPNLPSGQSHAISSGRRVSGNYPYRNNPNWGY